MKGERGRPRLFLKRFFCFFFHENIRMGWSTEGLAQKEHDISARMCVCVLAGGGGEMHWSETARRLKGPPEEGSATDKNPKGERTRCLGDCHPSSACSSMRKVQNLWIKKKKKSKTRYQATWEHFSLFKSEDPSCEKKKPEVEYSAGTPSLTSLGSSWLCN